MGREGRLRSGGLGSPGRSYAPQQALSLSREGGKPGGAPLSPGLAQAEEPSCSYGPPPGSWGPKNFLVPPGVMLLPTSPCYTPSSLGTRCRRSPGSPGGGGGSPSPMGRHALCQLCPRFLRRLCVPARQAGGACPLGSGRAPVLPWVPA